MSFKQMWKKHMNVYIIYSHYVQIELNVETPTLLMVVSS